MPKSTKGWFHQRKCGKCGNHQAVHTMDMNPKRKKHFPNLTIPCKKCDNEMLNNSKPI